MFHWEGGTYTLSLGWEGVLSRGTLFTDSLPLPIPPPGPSHITERNITENLAVI